MLLLFLLLLLLLLLVLRRYDHGHFFPGTGAVDEVGCGPAAGRTVNIPWDGPGPGDADYIAALTQV